MNDVMDRLQAANPVLEDPAPPPLEQLLARLDHKPPRRRLTRPLVLAVAAAVALLAVVLVSELRGPNVDVVAQAREALRQTTRGIIHMRVLEENFNADGSLVPRSGTRPEVRVARDPLRMRVLQPTRLGVAESDYADGVVRTVDPRTGKVQTQRMDAKTQREFEDVDARADVRQPGLDPVPAIRRLLAEGKLAHDGSTTLNGRKVERLVGADVEYLVDARTYAPVRLATTPTKGGRAVSFYRITFELYEVLPLTPANEALLRIQR
ncbi:MAG TPA: hypothetical protein VFZ00_35230 [Solirubrobacter sp.]|nr:hypothetical protein [Solirubrobacter sp.]